MEVVAGISASVTLGSESLKLTKKINRYAATLRFARKEIEDVGREFSLFIGLLKQMDKVVMGVGPRMLPAKERNDLYKNLRKQAISIQQETKVLLRKVRPLRTNSKASGFAQLQARASWLLGKANVVHLMAMLNTVKLSLMLFMVSVAVAELVEASKSRREISRENKIEM